MMTWDYLFLEFEVDDGERFALLQRAFDRLKADKTPNVPEDHPGDDDDVQVNLEPEVNTEDYLPYFDNYAARDYFLTDDEHWSGDIVRWTDLDMSMEKQWTIDSMLYWIIHSDYDLVSCELVDDGLGRLEFWPHATPYGSVAALRMMVECFGFPVIRLDDGGPQIIER